MLVALTDCTLNPVHHQSCPSGPCLALSLSSTFCLSFHIILFQYEAHIFLRFVCLREGVHASADVCEHVCR